MTLADLHAAGREKKKQKQQDQEEDEDEDIVDSEEEGKVKSDEVAEEEDIEFQDGQSLLTAALDPETIFHSASRLFLPSIAPSLSSSTFLFPGA